jgi:uncharacterized protein
MSLRLCLFSVVLISMGSLGASNAQTTAPRIVDTLVHYKLTNDQGDPGFLDELVAKLDSVNGVAIISTTPEDLGTLVAFIKQHPNRLKCQGRLSLDDPAAVDLVDLFHAAGCVGLGEILGPLKNFDDRSYWPIYARAEQYGMILHFHTGIVNRLTPEVPSDVSVDRMRATALDGIARRFPKLTIIGAHMGNPDYAWAAEEARWDPNLYFDLSGSSLIKKQDDPGFWKSIFWWSGVTSPHTPAGEHDAYERLVFGSDVAAGDLQEFDLELARYHKMLDACGVSKATQDMIFAGTMLHLLAVQK